jgi:hypothetical protein
MSPDQAASSEAPRWRFIEFNSRRAMRSAAAAKVEIEPDGNWLWMNKSDIKKNIGSFGDHPELQRALAAYGAWA